MTNFKPFKVSNYITPEEALKKLENYHPPKTPEPPVEKPAITPSIIISADIQSPENWLFLESRQHGIYTQPDLLVNLYRLNATPEVQKAAQSINLAVANTARQKDGHISDYIGSINHKQAMDLVIASGYAPLNTSIFTDFLSDIHQALTNNKLYNASGSHINHGLLQAVYNDIIEERSPYRAERLSAQFSDINNKRHITYHRFNSQGALEQVTEPLDPDTLMVDKKPGISLENWLSNPTSHGLPRNGISDGNLWYWHPRGNHVAGFGASSGWAFVDCVVDPLSSNASLGVRVCAAGAPKK